MYIIFDSWERNTIQAIFLEEFQMNPLSGVAFMVQIRPLGSIKSLHFQ
jgi:hypothetical protein